jgi:hypothetical protein
MRKLTYRVEKTIYREVGECTVQRRKEECKLYYRLFFDAESTRIKLLASMDCTQRIARDNRKKDIMSSS